MSNAAAIVQQAADHSGWEAALLVCIVLSGFGCFGYVIRQTILDLRELQKFVREGMADVIDDNTVCWARVGQILRHRPCLNDSDVDRISQGNGTKDDPEDTPDLDATAMRAIERRKSRQAKRGQQQA